MTIDEAIKHAEEVADKKEREKQKWDKWLEHDNDYRAIAEKMSCESCAVEHRQLAEWLKELKQLREQTRWISVGTTYGDVIKAIFNPYKVCEYKYGVHVYMTEEDFWKADFQMNFDANWWNAPYKTESEEV